MDADGRLRVAILFGGCSGEHDVSLQSAASVVAALDRGRFAPTLIGITRAGRWHLAESAPAQPDTLLETGRGREVAVAPGRGLLTLDDAALVDVDVVFPVLHGPNGEDGTVQGLLELSGLPYVGSGVLASAVAMDKAMMKDVFRQSGLKTVDWVLVRRSDWQTDADREVLRVEQRLRYPLFTKPANLGSSVGISKCRNRDELRQGLDIAAKHDRRLLVEQGVDAHEVECGVLGGENPEASVPGEIVPLRDFYDYEAKYADAGTRLIVPAVLPPRVAEEVRTLAQSAFRALDCYGLARVDFFVERASNCVLVNEVNTIPGFTRVSMYPRLWEASGWTYTKLLSRLIDLACTRQRDVARGTS